VLRREYRARFTGRRSSANHARGCSSAGRAPALQAGGHRFDPGQLHHPTAQRQETDNTETVTGAGLSLEGAPTRVLLRLLFRSLTIWNDPSIEVEYGFDKRRTVFF
jgi:hypothetical protein